MTLRDRLAKERQERQAGMLKEQLKKKGRKKRTFISTSPFLLF